MSEILYCKDCGDELVDPSVKDVVNFLYTHTGHNTEIEDDL